MKSILCTCAVFLVLPWKLTGEITFSPSSTMKHDESFKPHGSTIRSNELNISTTNQTTHRQNEVVLKHKTTLRTAGATIFSPKNTEHTSNHHGKTTNSQTTLRQHEDIITGNETTIRSATSTMFSPKNTELPLKTHGKTTDGQTSTLRHKVTSKGNGTTKRIARSSLLPLNTTESKTNGKTTNSQTTNRQHEGIIGNETTTRSAEPTIYTTKNINLPLKQNTTNSSASTGLYEGHETITNGYKSMTSLLQTQHKYITEESKKVSSSTSLPQTLKHQHATSVSNAETPTHTVMSSGEESRSSSHSSFVTAQTRNMSDKVTTRRSFNFTSKGPDIYTHENQTTINGAKEPSKSQTDMSTHFEKTPEVITSSSEIEVKTTGTVTTKWSSHSQVNESTPLPILTGTYPLNASTTTGVSTLLSPNVDTESGTTKTTNTLDTTTYEITKNTAGEKKSSPESRTTPITQTDSVTTTTSKSPTNESNKESHPGRIVAFLIGTILCLMLIAFVVIMFKNRQKKKKQKENPDWAGPSPFIEADINPQPRSNNEDGSFHNHEFKRISLHSFLPQRLSKRLSMLSPTEEEIPLEDTQMSSTFGKGNGEPLNGNATQAQIQNIEENSPPTEVTLDTNIPEAVKNSPPTENDEHIPTTPKLDEVIPPPPAEIETATSTTFEDVDLNLSPEKNTETSSPSDVLHATSPPLAPS